jgi:biopolymer transport protein ExbD
MIQKQRNRPHPVVSTASLPDIVFMLLFFFMVATVLRQQKNLLQIRLPKAAEITKLQNRSLVQHIYMGKPVQKSHGDATRIQLNNAYISIHQLENAIRILSRDKQGLIHSLKVDEEVHMGLVIDVKTALRKAEQLKLNYEVIAGVGSDR